MATESRHRILKDLAVTGPAVWTMPIVASVVLPAHAGTSPARFCLCGGEFYEGQRVESIYSGDGLWVGAQRTVTAGSPNGLPGLPNFVIQVLWDSGPVAGYDCSAIPWARKGKPRIQIRATLTDHRASPRLYLL